MASITINRLSQETKERLHQHANQRGYSLEALARSILGAAALITVQKSNFPHNLISQVVPSDDIEPYLMDHDQPVTADDFA